jgi:hypothetical protein
VTLDDPAVVCAYAAAAFLIASWSIARRDA